LYGRGLLLSSVLLTRVLLLPEAAELSADLERRLAENALLTEFRLRPDGLRLLPDYDGAQDFRQRHAVLKPHAVQEALFAVPPGMLQPDAETAVRLLLLTPTLANLTYRERGQKSVLLFKDVRLLEPPQDDVAVVQIEDQDFGTVRFRVRTEVSGGRIELRLVNLDALKYLFLPAVPPQRALVDLLYLPGPERALIYAAWSVRSYLFIPAAAGVEVPLRQRALALKEWFVHLDLDAAP